MQEQISQFPIVVEVPVQWGDMDAARHVNNVIYLRWGESARIEYFNAIKLPSDFNSAEGPILGYQDCKYIFPLTYPDTAIVGAKAIEIKSDRFIMECHIFSKKHQRLAAITKNVIIPYNYLTLKKIELPKTWIENITKLQSEL